MTTTRCWHRAIAALAPTAMILACEPDAVDPPPCVGQVCSVAVPPDVQPVAGLYAVDDLPADTVVMASESRFIDGDLDASAGVDVGPTGASFQNVGLDMGRDAVVDELRIHVRTSAGQPVAFGGPVGWTVWASEDGLAWAVVPGQAQGFNVVLSAYIVEFTETTARFFKAVSFGVNTVDTLVTELQPFVQQSVCPCPE
jgi:hypothetical protein